MQSQPHGTGGYIYAPLAFIKSTIVYITCFANCSIISPPIMVNRVHLSLMAPPVFLEKRQVGNPCISIV